ncbi:hypothetical protein [Amycolatopsis taiwanensis]|uniref:Uncharacterized protein n=1 Tax=Amycolatopsis taiwanensis TaxID=342230 RepID=A0A9W6R887_9PSEU|nr:hypothetical protein [Amycolatopsis taiwanensis]GLY71073.1 hypothetical protein Atai01_76920 [Amycolatopsis taiwanensis]
MDTERTLSEQVGPLPPGIAALSDEHQWDLADAVRGARRRQAAALAKVGDDSLRHVPALLRPVIRKAVGL